MKDRNIILGFTGGIGRAAAKALVKRGEKITVYVRSVEKAKKYINDLKGVELIQGDVYDSSKLKAVLGSAKTLYYCINVPYPKWNSEVRPLLRIVIDICIKKNVKLIFPGNVYVYGLPRYNPVNEKHPFQPNSRKGKIRVDMELMLEEAAKSRGLSYTIVRFPDFYGPYVINTFTEKLFINALKGKQIIWFGDLDVPYETIFIEDAGEAMVSAAEKCRKNNDTFNIPGYSETTARKILEEVSKQGGKNSKVKGINSGWFISFGGLFNSIAREFKEMMYLKQIKLILDGSKFEVEIGTVPKTSYEQGIQKTLSWAKEFYNI